MLIRPRRVSMSGMEYAENGIVPDEIPRIDWITVIVRIAHQPCVVDRLDAPVNACGRAAVELSLVDIDPLLILRAGAIVLVRRTCPAGQAVPSSVLWRGVPPVIRPALKNTHFRRGGAGHIRLR